jgi:hypothetical protein
MDEQEVREIVTQEIYPIGCFTSALILVVFLLAGALISKFGWSFLVSWMSK